MKVLVVDDEELIRGVIKEYLMLEKYEVDEAANGLEAVGMCEKNKYDIIIMDIMMPHMDGLTACRKIKTFDEDVPFIFLSARTEEYDKLKAFDLGIDDYITKPFSPRELVARVKAVLKRLDKSKDKYVFGGLVMDVLAHEVYIDNEKLDLTPKEFNLLKYLIENKNIAITRENLLLNVWGYDYYGEDRTIDTHIKTLRNHLGKYRDTIKTVRGMGYKFTYAEKTN